MISMLFNWYKRRIKICLKLLAQGILGELGNPAVIIRYSKLINGKWEVLAERRIEASQYLNLR